MEFPTVVHSIPTAIQTRIQSMGYKQGRLSPTREVGTHLFQELIMKAIAASEAKS
jgi:hypothetical protein